MRPLEKRLLKMHLSIVREYVRTRFFAPDVLHSRALEMVDKVG